MQGNRNGPSGRRPHRNVLLAVVGLVLLAGCSDEGPVSGPGTMTATLVGPNAAEGAAVVLLMGSDVGAITAESGVQAWSQEAAGGTKVVLVHPDGGALSFQVAVADTTQPPAWVVEEVAGPDDALRNDLTAYTVEFAR